MYAGAGLLFPACLDRSTVSRCVCSAQTSLNCAAVAVRKKTPRIFGEQFQRTGQALSAVWRVSFPFIPSPKDLNAVPAHLVKNTAHMDALLHAPSDTSAAQFIILPGITQRGGFHPAFVRRQNPLFWRKPHESNMGAASAPLHRFRRFFAFVHRRLSGVSFLVCARRSISGCQCVLTPAQDHAQPCVALPAYWLGAYGSLGTLTPARLPHVSVLRIAPRVLRRSLPHPTYEYPAWHASLRLDRMFNRGRDLRPA